MSQTADRLARAHTDLNEMMRKLEHGRIDRQSRMSRLELAEAHIEEWLDVRTPRPGERGGSSTVREAEDRDEERRLGGQVMRDRDRLVELARMIPALTAEASLIVARYVEVVDASRLPKVGDTVPGCRSCARTLRRGAQLLGGHFAPVRDSAVVHGLCDWCYRFALDARPDDWPKGCPFPAEWWPPVEACELLHAQSAQAAGRWLARQQVPA